MTLHIRIEKRKRCFSAYLRVDGIYIVIGFVKRRLLTNANERDPILYGRKKDTIRGLTLFSKNVNDSGVLTSPSNNPK